METTKKALSNMPTLGIWLLAMTFGASAEPGRDLSASPAQEHGTNPRLGGTSESQNPSVGTKRSGYVTKADLDAVTIGTLPSATDRAAGRWPKYFIQKYSRSQSGQIEDMNFEMGFVLQPQVRNGKRCLAVTFKVVANVRSNLRYVRDRVSSWSLYNEGPGPGKGKKSALKSPSKETPKEAAPEPAPLRDSAIDRPRWRTVNWVKTPFYPDTNPARWTKAYISYGSEVHLGELEVACLDEAGTYEGLVELKAGPKAPEKVSIPWRVTYEKGDAPVMHFGMHEVAIPDTDSFQGYLHPRPSLTTKEWVRLREIDYRLTGTSGTAPGEKRTPTGPYAAPKASPDDVEKPGGDA